jgi:hypothetical protein
VLSSTHSSAAAPKPLGYQQVPQDESVCLHEGTDVRTHVCLKTAPSEEPFISDLP